MMQTMMAMMKRWTSRERPAVPEVPEVIEFTDHHVVILERARAQLTEARARLAREESRWTKLQARGDDPETDLARRTVGPEILALRQAVVRLAAEEVAEEATIRTTITRAAEYAAASTAAAAWIDPIVALLPTADQITRALKLSQDLNRRAAELRERSGDRQFRKALVDPFAEIHAALEEALRQVERRRLSRHPAAGLVAELDTRQ